MPTASHANPSHRLSTKASFSSSPLAASTAPIHRLAASIQDYLHFPDPHPLYVVAAALVANYAVGRPVWLMLIGPSSCGKSELLNSLLSLPRIVEGGAVTGVGALLSGSRKKERTAESTGGLLRDIGDRGALVIKEFTSILSLPHETLRGVLAAFREIYDGRWTRPAGTDGGATLHWEGKMGFLTGCTEAIDHHAAMTAHMGERFLQYRYVTSDGWTETYKALSIANGETLSAQLQQLVLSFAENLGLDWDNPPELPELDSHDKQRLIAFAQFAAHGRSSVTRDSYTKEIIQASVGEYPMRLALVMGQLLSALRYIGVHETDSWQIICKCSFDSFPGNRRLAMLALLKGADSTVDIAEHIRVSQATAKRALEELKIYQLVDRPTPSTWAVSPWARTRLKEALNGTGQSSRTLARVS